MTATSAVTSTDTLSPRPSSPWNQTPTLAIEHSSDAANAAMRPAWKKPTNGAAAVAAEIVMGAESWPALSESTKPPGKLEPLKQPDVHSVSQPVSQGQPNPPNMVPALQKSMKRNGGGSTSTNGSFTQPFSPPVPLVDVPSTNHSTRDTIQRSGFGSHNGNNHPQRNSFRNRNGGPHPRGDGSHHHNYGARRDQDRSNQDWNAHRSFSGRDAQLQHRIIPRFIAPPPPPTSAHFLPRSSVQHFGGPIAFPEQLAAAPMYFVGAPPPESLRGGVPFVGQMPPPPAVYMPPSDCHLHVPIVAQVDYYFSNENLVKDTYLRQNMDDQGWVSIKLIAGFKKLKFLTENIQLILDAVQASTLVEVQGDKIRRRNDWMKWIMPPTVQFSNRTNPPQSGMSSHDMLTGRIQGLNLEKATNNSSARGQARRSESGEFNSQSKQASSEGTGQFSVPAGSGQSGPATN